MASDTKRTWDAESMLDLLSEAGMGAILLDEKGIAVHVNVMGREYLDGSGIGEGEPLPEKLKALCDEDESPEPIRIDFSAYVTRENILYEVPGYPGGRIVIFRDSTGETMLRMLSDAVNGMNEALIVCDEEDRIFFCNMALLRLDSLIADEVIGEKIEDVYDMEGGIECMIPQVRRSMVPHLNHRQYYSTRYGKQLTTISNTFPIVERSHVIGAYNVLEDWSATGNLQKQIYEIQEQLLEQKGQSSGSGNRALRAKYHFEDIIYNCEEVQRAIRHCRMAARTDASILLYGETGTGKELFAQSIHNESARAEKPFLAVNCAALPGSLLESILFGTVKGAFTGADDRAGLFEQARGGTLLLDELNSMDIGLQAKLLRVLQEGMVRRVGGDKVIRLDVRIIAITNVPPQEAIRDGQLRQDLYFRLAAVYISIPPLRERGQDVFLLAQHFIAQDNRALRKNVRGLAQEVKDIFRQYSWRGNVRELEHCIQHAMSIMPYGEDLITPEYLPEHIWPSAAARARAAAAARETAGETPDFAFGEQTPGTSGAAGNGVAGPPAGAFPGSVTGHAVAAGGIRSSVRGFERERIIEELKAFGGNVTKAAEAFGISRQSLQYRLRKYRIDAEKIRLESDEKGG